MVRRKEEWSPAGAPRKPSSHCRSHTPSRNVRRVMALTVGTTLSHYRLVAPIGEGGMGVVWRATDSTLGRDVAIKVLPDLFASDPERLARFEREARLLASLNHPHVASIFGLDSANGVRFLAMELVEGADLAERLEHGPIPVAEALPIALQIAQALEHAHERGVIHRDLKPANVKLTATGDAKVLDFGLAKALEGEPIAPTSSALRSYSPTITAHMTGAQVLLGTAAYMSPEQARGQVADRRADIWAFGVVLMEMLPGGRLFPGDTISDTLAGVLKTDPEWSALPAEVPARVRKLLRRCLERDAKRRLRDIGEARIILEEVIAGVPDETVSVAASAAPPTARPNGALPWIVAGVAGLMIGAAAMMIAGRVTRPAPAAPLTKFRLALPATDGAPTYPSIAPDGRSVAYLMAGSLWIQALGELDPRKFPIEANASRLFWSPDAKHIGYIAGTRIFRTTLGGAENQLVCDTRGSISSGGWGATWRDDGTIVYSRGDTAGLMVVASKGGDPHSLLRPDTSETDFHEPWALPGDRGILFASHRKSGGISELCLWTKRGRKVLLDLPGQTVYTPSYSPTGHVLFRRTPTTPGVWALPFSLERLEATGEPFIVAPLGVNPTVANDGSLAYIHQTAGGMTEMFWADRSGKALGTIGSPEPDASETPALSPDGSSAIRSILAGGNRDLWRFDTHRGTRTRLTFDPAFEDAAVFSPSGDRIAYHASGSASSAESFRVVTRRADGTGSADTLAFSAAVPRYTPDGKHVLYSALLEGGARWNLSQVATTPGSTPRVLVEGNPWVTDGRVSPSGDFMAYTSNESGRWEVFLTHYPSCEGKWQVSAEGGQSPRWDAAGRRLYYLEGDRIMEVAVTPGATPGLTTPTLLFTRPPTTPGTFALHPTFEITRDAQRFLLTRSTGGQGGAQGPTVVQNWLSEFAEAKGSRSR